MNNKRHFLPLWKLFVLKEQEATVTFLCEAGGRLDHHDKGA